MPPTAEATLEAKVEAKSFGFVQVALATLSLSVVLVAAVGEIGTGGRSLPAFPPRPTPAESAGLVTCGPKVSMARDEMGLSRHNTECAQHLLSTSLVCAVLTLASL